MKLIQGYNHSSSIGYPTTIGIFSYVKHRKYLWRVTSDKYIDYTIWLKNHVKVPRRTNEIT